MYCLGHNSSQTSDKSEGALVVEGILHQKNSIA